MFTLTRYVCPACKTRNKPSLKYCRKCGQWLLDTIHESKQIKTQPFKIIVNLVKAIILGVFAVVVLGVVLAIVN